VLYHDDYAVGAHMAEEVGAKWRTELMMNQHHFSYNVIIV
jgi:hypothetical protein